MKSWFLSTSPTEAIGFVVRKIPSSYHCQQVSGLLFICVVLADEDLTQVSLAEGAIDVAGGPTGRGLCSCDVEGWEYCIMGRVGRVSARAGGEVCMGVCRVWGHARCV